MPLDEIGRRYADNLFWQGQEEILQKQKKELAEVEADYGRRNMTKSGLYTKARAEVLLEGISRLVDAKVDSLFKAYDRAGLPYDETAFQEIKTEAMQYCHSQQHNVVGGIARTIQQTFGPQGAPRGFQEATVQQIIEGVDRIMARIARDLAIKRDESILDERKLRKVYAAGLGKRWDVFICHASEDKDDFVRPLAMRLQESGLSIWYDEFALKVGDSLRKKIDEGLANSRYGIVVLSRHFFAKNWPQHELDGLMSREIAGAKVIFPVWHNISLEEVRSRSPMLSGLVAAKSSEGMEVVVKKLREAMGL